MAFERVWMHGSKSAGAAASRALRVALALSASGASVSCASAPRYRDSPPLWEDTDRRPVSEKAEERDSLVMWEALDNAVFAPLSSSLALERTGSSVNVNAVDEVPNSSWFENRIGLGGYAPERVARGACTERPPDPRQKWIIHSAKPDGANPGFMVADEEGRKFLLKFGGTIQGPRPMAAATIGSRVFHAAGYYTPCDRVVYLRRENLVIKEGTLIPDRVDGIGKKRPLREDDVDRALAQGLTLRDGRTQALSSLFVEGEPLGPWSYAGTDSTDLNDVVPHTRRRELRGMRLLSAWIGHYDSRDGNTLSAWIAQRKGGYVRHYVIDFGESLGSLWSPADLGRSIGYHAYIDPGDIAENWLSLGFVERPYRFARFGPSGRIFGYYDVDTFTPDAFQACIQNPAFEAMTDDDAAWMARIISHFDEPHVRALIGTADLRDPELEAELFRLLWGRRNKILDRYLTVRSPLSHPNVTPHAGGQTAACVTDLWTRSGRGPTGKKERDYAGWLQTDGGERRPISLDVRGHEVCARVPPESQYTILTIESAARSAAKNALELHLGRDGAGVLRVRGLRRWAD